MEPFVPAGVCHAVADHHGEAAGLQRHGGYIRCGRSAPQSHRQAAAGDPADGAVLFQIAGGGTELVEGGLRAFQNAQIHRGKAAGLRTPEGHGGVQGGEGSLRLDIRLQKLPQQPAGEGGLPPGGVPAAHTVRQQQAPETAVRAEGLHGVAADHFPLLGPQSRADNAGRDLSKGGGRPAETGGRRRQQVRHLGVLPLGAAARFFQLAAVLLPQQKGRQFPIDGLQQF